LLHEIKIETHINKIPEEVWKVIADFPSYPKWNPFLRKISKPDDKSLLIEITLPSSKGWCVWKFLKCPKMMNFFGEVLSLGDGFLEAIII
jgi:uncharacterized membrane protein